MQHSAVSLFALTLLTVIAGCPEVKEGFFACEESSDCHSSQTCFEGLCYTSPPDASLPDAMLDTMPNTPDASVPDADADADPVPPPDAEEPAKPPVDLLIMLDNSPSMRPRLPRVIDGIETLVEELSWSDLRLAFITPDLATPSLIPDATDCMGGGSELQFPDASEIGNQSICDGQAPFTKFLSGESLTREKVACYINQLSACGLEFTLESLVQALSQNSSSEFFPGSARGTFDEDFHRTDAKRVIVIISDEDDCSGGRDASFYSPLTSGLCVSKIAMLRDADSFASVMPNPEDTVLAVLAGMPIDVNLAAAGTILNDTQMVPTLDQDGVPRAVCQDVTPASAAQRLVVFGGKLSELGASDVYSSICEAKYDAFMTEVAAQAFAL